MISPRRTFRHLRSVSRLPAVLAIVCSAGACAGRDGNESGGGITAWQQAVAVDHRISLEEPEGVVTVAPMVSLDPRGGFLIADGSEAQVRRYTPDGKLLWRAGRRGGGPGEFSFVRAAVRLRNGNVFVVDHDGQLTELDSVGSRVVQTIRSPLRGVEDVEVISDSVLLISGMLRGDVRSARLHLWSLSRGGVIRSFFTPFQNTVNPVAATIAGWTETAVRGDTVAAIFALSDSVHLFTVQGAPIRALPLPSSRFRRVGREVPDAGNDPVRRSDWLSSFDYVADVHWSEDGGFLVGYQSIVPGGAYTRQWHLVRLDRDGGKRSETRDVPRLLAVDSRRNGLYFIAPGAETENLWVVAKLR